jgi:phage host-nuclease inhibitor protein Gam
MNKNKKPPIVPILSRAALDAVVAEIATLKIQYAAAQADLELEVARAQQRRQEQMSTLARQIESREAGVFLYCRQHRAQLFPGKKSLDFPLATVGFRTEPPSVQKSSRKDTWTAIAQRMEASAWGSRYTSLPEPEVDKKALLADREKLSLEQLAEVGIIFQQDELFYITPKSEVALRTVREAA